ncbi:MULTISPECIES: DUF6893 family small protein [Streptomyces]|uniref:Uncharacterized protein n=1 Tax=Streptomyces solicathayae TaxID=3081768 RepID=A0ABZ0LM82_9ACTN|nr:hypothetical protein [Streptomyces sp. HUAS YS2]WOX20370.1 hypothetical protein R2D22_02815 [Streptomyces sp. HUAS YS2]
MNTETESPMHRNVLGAALAATAALAVVAVLAGALPDLRRYLRISRM